MFFEEFNFVPLEAVFGEETIEIFRARLKDREAVESTMNFCRSRSDLMREETLATWSGEDGMEPIDDEPDDPIVLRFRANARMFALSIADVLRSPRPALVNLRGQAADGGCGKWHCSGRRACQEPRSSGRMLSNSQDSLGEPGKRTTRTSGVKLLMALWRPLRRTSCAKPVKAVFKQS